jgi:general secretion pathway protein G
VSPSFSHRSGTAGFTLLELLVVLVILGLLAAIATPQVMKYLSRARSQSAALQIHNLASAIDLYRLDVGRYPSQEASAAPLPAYSGRPARDLNSAIRREDRMKLVATVLAAMAQVR